MGLLRIVPWMTWFWLTIILLLLAMLLMWETWKCWSRPQLRWSRYLTTGFMVTTTIVGLYLLLTGPASLFP